MEHKDIVETRRRMTNSGTLHERDFIISYSKQHTSQVVEAFSALTLVTEVYENIESLKEVILTSRPFVILVTHEFDEAHSTIASLLEQYSSKPIIL